MPTFSPNNGPNSALLDLTTELAYLFNRSPLPSPPLPATPWSSAVVGCCSHTSLHSNILHSPIHSSIHQPVSQFIHCLISRSICPSFSPISSLLSQSLQTPSFHTHNFSFLLVKALLLPNSLNYAAHSSQSKVHVCLPEQEAIVNPMPFLFYGSCVFSSHTF